MIDVGVDRQRKSPRFGHSWLTGKKDPNAKTTEREMAERQQTQARKGDVQEKMIIIMKR